VPDDIPEIEVLEPELRIIELLKLCQPETTNSNLRRLVEQGGVSLDDKKILEPTLTVKINDGAVLRVGKRQFYKLTLKK
jgi:tyrosyl-tRNA synthetase